MYKFKENLEFEHPWERQFHGGEEKETNNKMEIIIYSNKRILNVQSHVNMISNLFKIQKTVITTQCRYVNDTLSNE